ncbi:MAG: hypothetical protein Q9209_003346 [Squamulea sp. 1 TL-2023]
MTITLRLTRREADGSLMAIHQLTTTTAGMKEPIAPTGTVIALATDPGVVPDLAQDTGHATARTIGTEDILTPDLETQRKMQKLEELERKEEEEAARERVKEEMLVAEAKKVAKKKQEEEFKKKVLEDAEREKYEKEMKEKKKKEEDDKIFKARLKEMYLAQGYSEESIERMIKEAEKKRKHGVHNPHIPGSPHALIAHEGAMVQKKEQMNVVNLNRTTYIKVHRKYLSPDTLDAYDLPWEWDDRDSNYIVIKQWINENDQDKLFEHTRKLREQRLLTSAPVELIKEKGKLKLVREKSPARSAMFCSLEDDRVL